MTVPENPAAQTEILPPAAPITPQPPGTSARGTALALATRLPMPCSPCLMGSMQSCGVCSGFGRLWAHGARVAGGETGMAGQAGGGV